MRPESVAEQATQPTEKPTSPKERPPSKTIVNLVKALYPSSLLAPENLISRILIEELSEQLSEQLPLSLGQHRAGRLKKMEPILDDILEAYCSIVAAYLQENNAENLLIDPIRNTLALNHLIVSRREFWTTAHQNILEILANSALIFCDTDITSPLLIFASCETIPLDSLTPLLYRLSLIFFNHKMTIPDGVKKKLHIQGNVSPLQLAVKAKHHDFIQLFLNHCLETRYLAKFKEFTDALDLAVRKDKFRSAELLLEFFDKTIDSALYNDTELKRTLTAQYFPHLMELFLMAIKKPTSTCLSLLVKRLIPYLFSQYPKQLAQFQKQVANILVCIVRIKNEDLFNLAIRLIEEYVTHSDGLWTVSASSHPMRLNESSLKQFSHLELTTVDHLLKLVLDPISYEAVVQAILLEYSLIFNLTPSANGTACEQMQEAVSSSLTTTTSPKQLEPLFFAVRDHSSITLQRLLQAGADPLAPVGNYPPYDKYNAAQLACYLGSISCLKVLFYDWHPPVSLPASQWNPIQYFDVGTLSLLEIAIAHGHHELISEFLLPSYDAIQKKFHWNCFSHRSSLQSSSSLEPLLTLMLKNEACHYLLCIFEWVEKDKQASLASQLLILAAKQANLSVKQAELVVKIVRDFGVVDESDCWDDDDDCFPLSPKREALYLDQGNLWCALEPSIDDAVLNKLINMKKMHILKTLCLKNAVYLTNIEKMLSELLEKIPTYSPDIYHASFSLSAPPKRKKLLDLGEVETNRATQFFCNHMLSFIRTLEGSRFASDFIQFYDLLGYGACSTGESPMKPPQQARFFGSDPVSLPSKKEASEAPEKEESERQKDKLFLHGA